ncbi:unnamed protein product [Protopolystoma xenopodis]|uniref:Uncharacterized protein n=1 Tax=Protopolystoma xenopodis TaxID=117903 RepID=A0A448WFA9_9PLAT|nr:unnamed protein product [Protopolystoma xenopodis]
MAEVQPCDTLSVCLDWSQWNSHNAIKASKPIGIVNKHQSYNLFCLKSSYGGRFAKCNPNQGSALPSLRPGLSMRTSFVWWYGKCRGVCPDELRQTRESPDTGLSAEGRSVADSTQNLYRFCLIPVPLFSMLACPKAWMFVRLFVRSSTRLLVPSSVQPFAHSSARLLVCLALPSRRHNYGTETLAKAIVHTHP